MQVEILPRQDAELLDWDECRHVIHVPFSLLALPRYSE
jgi:hypothetical protein